MLSITSDAMVRLSSTGVKGEWWVMNRDDNLAV